MCPTSFRNCSSSWSTVPDSQLLPITGVSAPSALLSSSAPATPIGSEGDLCPLVSGETVFFSTSASLSCLAFSVVSPPSGLGFSAKLGLRGGGRTDFVFLSLACQNPKLYGFAGAAWSRIGLLAALLAFDITLRVSHPSAGLGENHLAALILLIVKNLADGP